MRGCGRLTALWPPRSAALGWLLLLVAEGPRAVSAVREADLSHVFAKALARRGRERNHPPEAHGTDELATYSTEEVEASKHEATVQAKAERKDGTLVTFMLIGAIIADMAILYLVNSSDPQIQSYSYKLLSIGVIVLCALTVESLQHNLYHKLLHRAEDAMGLHLSSGTHNMISWVTTSFIFVFWFFNISVCSARYRDRLQDQYSALGLISHICAFSVLEHVGHAQEKAAEQWVSRTHIAPEFGHGQLAHLDSTLLSLYVSVPVLTWLVYQISAEVADVLRTRCLGGGEGAISGGDAEHAAQALVPGDENASIPSVRDRPGFHGEDGYHAGDEHRDEHEHANHHHDWKMEAVHAEADSCAIVVGFLIKQCIVYVIRGHPSSMDCSKTPIKCKVSHSEMWALGLLALALYAALMLISVYHVRLGTRRWLVRLELLLGMTMSWLLLQLSVWTVIDFVWDRPGDSPLHAATVKKLLCASGLSPLLLLVILQVDLLADKGIIGCTTAETTVQCIAFLIGFYWEKVFLSAIHHITESVGTNQNLVPDVLVNLGLLCIIMPGWRWWLVPRAAEPVPERRLDQVSTSDLVGQSSFYKLAKKAISANAINGNAKPAAVRGVDSREGTPQPSSEEAENGDGGRLRKAAEEEEQEEGGRA